MISQRLNHLSNWHSWLRDSWCGTQRDRLLDPCSPHRVFRPSPPLFPGMDLIIILLPDASTGTNPMPAAPLSRAAGML